MNYNFYNLLFLCMCPKIMDMKRYFKRKYQNIPIGIQWGSEISQSQSDLLTYISQLKQNAPPGPFGGRESAWARESWNGVRASLPPVSNSASGHGAGAPCYGA